MPVLHILSGFIGTGKTTFSKKLAAETGAIRLNADEICLASFSQEELAADWDGCFGKAVEKVYDSASSFLKEGRDVILDVGFWTRQSRDEAKSFGEATGAECRLYYVHAPDSVLLERLKSRSGSIAEMNVTNFSFLRKIYEEPRAEEGAIPVVTG